MKMKHYRISAGAYRVGEFLILRESGHSWQVRDKFDNVEQQFGTLRECIKYAKTQKALILARNVRAAALPVDPTELRQMLAGRPS
jgi:hypothetical protein